MGRKPKLWSVTVGGHGHSVTASERRPGGLLSIRWWDSSRGAPTWRALGHPDKAKAEEQARALSSELLSAGKAARSPRLTMIELLARYEREVTAYKKGSQPAEDHRRIEMWQSILGEREARAIDFPTLDKFVRDRKAGLIAVPGRKLSSRPSDTTIGSDLIFLASVLNWATHVRLPNGEPLLAANPINGYERPKNKNPRQPVATYDRYLLVRQFADDIDPQRLFSSFLDLVEGLGWRVSAICQLLASDFDRHSSEHAPFGRLKKRSETDKEGVDMWVPLAQNTRTAIERILATNAVVGEMPLFPAPRAKDGNRAASWTRFHARNLLGRAEKAAGLAPIEGGDFHPYRRAWSTARKGLPTADVAAAGGWRDLRSLERSYIKADEATMLRVVTEPGRVRSVSGA